MNLPKQISVNRLMSVCRLPESADTLVPAAACRPGESPCHCQHDEAECCPAGTRCDCSTTYNRCLGPGGRRGPARRAGD